MQHKLGILHPFSFGEITVIDNLTLVPPAKTISVSCVPRFSLYFDNKQSTSPNEQATRCHICIQDYSLSKLSANTSLEVE